MCVWRFVRPLTRRLNGPRLPSQSSVTITGQRQQRLRAITEIARDDLECPPQHRENHFLTKRQPLSSAGPWKLTGQNPEPFFCLSHLQEWWTYTEVGSESENREIRKLKSNRCRALRAEQIRKQREKDDTLMHLLMGSEEAEENWYKVNGMRKKYGMKLN